MIYFYFVVDNSPFCPFEMLCAWKKTPAFMPQGREIKI
jgi:hypothetical protein